MLSRISITFTIFPSSKLMMVPPSFFPIFKYSLSGSITYCVIFIYLFLAIISFVKYDFPEPEVPIIHMLAFLYFSESKRSTITMDLLRSFTPIKIPCSSQSSLDKKGYVLTRPEVSTFLLIYFFTPKSC